MACSTPRHLLPRPCRPDRERGSRRRPTVPRSTRGASRGSSGCSFCRRRQALLKELQDDKDRREFQKIFWARRDPTPGTPANEFEDNVRAVWKHADDLFSYPNQKGSETGCGQVLALLGRPEEYLGKGDVPRQPSVDVTGRGGRELPAAPGPGRPFDNTAYLREGSTREPETWVYRDRPGLPYTFTGAELRIAFDSECRFAEGGILAEDLRPRRGRARHAARSRLRAAGATGTSCRSPRQRGTAARRRARSPDDTADRLPPRRRDEARHARTEGRGARGGPRPLPSPAAGAVAPGRVSLAVRRPPTRAGRPW